MGPGSRYARHVFHTCTYAHKMYGCVCSFVYIYIYIYIIYIYAYIHTCMCEHMWPFSGP